jgi:bifunctional DNase/RNase
VRENVYFALIHLRKDNKDFPIDARPMDAIAIAVRANAPIFVKEDVLAKSPVADLSGHPVFSKTDRDRCTDVLADLGLYGFGKYKM